MYRRKTCHLNTPMDLLRFSPLTCIERLRMRLPAIHARAFGMSMGLDDVTAADWKRGMVGERMAVMLEGGKRERSEGLHVNELVGYAHRDSGLFKRRDGEMLATCRRCVSFRPA